MTYRDIIHRILFIIGLFSVIGGVVALFVLAVPPDAGSTPIQLVWDFDHSDPSNTRWSSAYRPWPQYSSEPLFAILDNASDWHSAGRLTGDGRFLAFNDHPDTPTPYGGHSFQVWFYRPAGVRQITLGFDVASWLTCDPNPAHIQVNAGAYNLYHGGWSSTDYNAWIGFDIDDNHWRHYQVDISLWATDWDNPGWYSIMLTDQTYATMGNDWALDNFTVSYNTSATDPAPVPAPEPATLYMVGAGLFLTARYVRRRQRWGQDK